MSLRGLSQKGDTIVEVLIAISIVSLVLISAYSIANFNLKKTRDSQERAEAMKIAEGQMEKLRYYAIDNLGAGNTFNDNPYCITHSPPYTLSRQTTSLAPGSWNNNCKTGVNNRYRFAIDYKAAGGDDLFTVYTRWESLTGDDNEVKLVYRLHR